MADKVEKLDTALIRELAKILTDGNLGEIEVEHGDLRIRVSMPEPAAISYAAAAAPAMAAPAAVAAAPVAALASPVAVAVNEANIVKSPMVGSSYLAAEPGAAPFINVGDKVKEGQTILLVEAMKTFNPVSSHKSGIVKEILVSDGQPVEYGEALVIIE